MNNSKQWIKFKLFRRLRKFLAPSVWKSSRWFHMSSSDDMQSEFPSWSFVLRLYPGKKNTKSDFFTTHSDCQQRRKAFCTGLPSSHSRTLSHPTQWEWGIVGVIYKLFRGLGYAVHLSLLGSGLSPYHLIYRDNFT